MTVAIIGSSIEQDNSVVGLNLEEMIYKAACAALADAEVPRSDIDQVCLGSSDGLDGRAISAMVTAASAGGVGKSVINVSSSGEHAMILAILQIMAGRSRKCIVANWAKPSDTPLSTVDRLTMDPFYYRPLQLDREMWLSLQTEALSADLVGAAGCGPSKPISSSAPRSGDGAIALVLTDEGTARKSGRAYTVLRGFGTATDSYWRGGPDLAEMPAARWAASQAYRMSGIKAPESAFDFIEVADHSRLHLLAICRSLGLVKKENILEFAAAIDVPGFRPEMNPSGGLAKRYLDYATGLATIASVHRRLIAKSTTSLALAHTASGNAGQVSSVFIIENQGAA